MNDSPAKLMRLFLVNSAVFSLPNTGGDWPVHESYFPDGGAIDAAVIYDTSPSLDDRWMDGTVRQHYGVTVRVRSVEYLDGWQKSMDILTLLAETVRESLTIGANTYSVDSFSLSSGINYLGIDDGTKRRYNFEIKYQLAIRQTA